MSLHFFFFFNDTATTEIYTLSLHDALPIFVARQAAPMMVSPGEGRWIDHLGATVDPLWLRARGRVGECIAVVRSEEHTSELQSRQYLVCRLLLEKKKNNIQ